MARSTRTRRPSPRRISFRSLRRLVLLIVTCLSLAGGFFMAKGRVISVADGDTVTVLSERGELVKVRLYGIDCPESRQKGGDEATAFARDMLLFQPVSLSVTDTDRYGRTVAIIRLEDGRIANEELVREGHAWVYRNYCKEPVCAGWLALEYAAKRQGRGLWRQKNPVPPWQWRRNNPR